MLHTGLTRFQGACRQGGRRERLLRLYGGNIDCAARPRKSVCEGRCKANGKESNKREKPLMAALRALCGQAGEGREKQSEKSAETFCFSGFRLPANLLGRWRTFGGFVGNGLDRSVRLNRIVRSIGKWRAIRRDFMRCAQPAVRMDQDPSLHSCLKKFFSTN